MTVTIRLFASLRERTGHTSLQREIPPGTTAGEVLAGLRQEFPRLQSAGRIAIAVNQEYTDAARVLEEGDEVALIPPVSGGCLSWAGCK
jgi:molybdopterin converting factor subunit 1